MGFNLINKPCWLLWNILECFCSIKLTVPWIFFFSFSYWSIEWAVWHVHATRCEHRGISYSGWGEIQNGVSSHSAFGWSRCHWLFYSGNLIPPMASISRSHTGLDGFSDRVISMIYMVPITMPIFSL